MLNNRQLDVLQYLLENTKYKRLNRTDIQKRFPTHYPRTSQNDYHDMGISMITKDIQEINNSYEVGYFVLSNSNGVKVANENEAMKELNKEKMAILRKLARLQHNFKKAKQNNSYKFDLNELSVELERTLI
jgi:hypothetical protein